MEEKEYKIQLGGGDVISFKASLFFKFLNWIVAMKHIFNGQKSYLSTALFGDTNYKIQHKMNSKIKNHSIGLNKYPCLNGQPQTSAYAWKDNIFLGRKIIVLWLGPPLSSQKLIKKTSFEQETVVVLWLFFLILYISSFEPKTIYRNKDHIS